MGMNLITLIKAMVAAGCIVLHPNNVLNGVSYGDGVYRTVTNESFLRDKAKEQIAEADKISKCEKLGKQLEELLK
jgi:hypothetical protein